MNQISLFDDDTYPQADDPEPDEDAEQRRYNELQRLLDRELRDLGWRLNAEIRSANDIHPRMKFYIAYNTRVNLRTNEWSSPRHAVQDAWDMTRLLEMFPPGIAAYLDPITLPLSPRLQSLADLIERQNVDTCLLFIPNARKTWKDEPPCLSEILPL